MPPEQVNNFRDVTPAADQYAAAATVYHLLTGQHVYDKAPSSVEFRDELARTATGKLQKFKLRAPYWEGCERQVN